MEFGELLIRQVQASLRKLNDKFGDVRLQIHVLKMGETWVLEEDFRKYSAQSEE